MFGARDNVAAGGLMSLAPDQVELSRRSAIYVDKILKGANPADLPVEQASRYLLTINLKTAKALDLEVPAKLLARADEVIDEAPKERAGSGPAGSA
jgi:putative tryptophan/tyrosine transport system substrate-binding protein